MSYRVELQPPSGERPKAAGPSKYRSFGRYGPITFLVAGVGRQLDRILELT